MLQGRGHCRFLSVFLVLLCLFGLLSFEDSATGEENPVSERRGGVVLVLSGGGTRGFAHVGVLKILERENIPVVGIVGTSIGSVIGGLYAVGYDAAQLHDIIMDTNIMGLVADTGYRLRPDSGNHRPAGEPATLYHASLNRDLKKIGPKGVLPALSLVNFLTKYTGHVRTTNFDYLPIPFACVATDLENGETVIIRDGNLASAIRASVSIPGLFEPWPIDGRLLVDGGLVANLPVEIAKNIFPGYPVVAVNLSGRSIAKSSDNFSGVVDVLVQTIDIMTVDKLRENEALADIVLYPDVSGFSILDSAGYDRIFESGVLVAEENVDALRRISAAAPPPPHERAKESGDRVVRGVRVEGVSPGAARDIEKSYGSWVDQPYDIDKVNNALVQLSRRDEVATVDVDTIPLDWNNPDDVEVLFSIEKRAPFEVALDGYTTNLHSRRWLSLALNGRDLLSDGDSALFEGRVGPDQWSTVLRYFTPMVNNGQWGFSISGRREKYDLYNMPEYSMERYAMRALYYMDGDRNRLGIGVAGENTNAIDGDTGAWGPFLYFNVDTLDNQLAPTQGYSLNSQIWWNSANIWVSRTRFTTYKPWLANLHFLLELGLETGSARNSAYRVILGDQEELYSLSAHPLIGDQGMWAHLGIVRNFYTSWWGSVRGELFARYGMVMMEWDRDEDAWEAGLALSVPGQFLNGKLLLIYDDDGQFTVGFTLGSPKWPNTPLP